MSGAMSLTLPWLMPLLLTLSARRQPAAAMLIAPLAALAAYRWAPVDTPLLLDWLLLGVHLELDATGRLFLLFSAIAWFAAAGYLVWTQAHRVLRGSFVLFFLLAMAGNFLLIAAADAITFYVGFALMGLSAYGMLVGRSQRARRAARRYLAFTLIGEVALIAALMLIVAQHGSPRFGDLANAPLTDSMVALLVLGFGIKVALPGLHLWLPPSYTAAPVVAVAVLSGPMMKAGLLGWLRFLSPQTGNLEAWGTALLVLGGLGVLLGVLAGLVQRNPRTVLAYSSVAKMGLMSALFGMALTRPEAAPAITAALVLLALHHLMVKSTLFLGVAEWQRRGPRPWLVFGLALLALSLAGAPLTGGAAAKAALVDALDGGLGWLLFAAALGTTLLMVRFMLLLLQRPVAAPPGADLIWLPGLALVMVAVAAPFAPEQLPFEAAAAVPLLVGLPLAGVAWWAIRRWRFIPPRMPRVRIARPLNRLGRAAATFIVDLVPAPVRWARDGAARPRQPAMPSGLLGPGIAWLAVLLSLLLMLIFPVSVGGGP